jgi:hypothetical protein
MRHHPNGSKVADKAKELYSSSRRLAEDEIERAGTFIHKNPVTSALLGVGLGFLLASIFRSRD